MLDRRDLLKLSGAAALGALLPSAGLAAGKNAHSGAGTEKENIHQGEG